MAKEETSQSFYVKKIGNKNFVFGLDWLIIQNRKNKNKEIADSFKRKKSSFGVKYPSSNPAEYGILLGENSPKNTVYSAASLFAEKYINAVLLAKISDNIFWLCVTKNGLVRPGYDLIGSKEELLEKIDYITGLTENTKYYGEIQNAEGIDLFKFLIDSKKGKHKITRLFGTDKKALVIAPVIFVGIIFSVVYFEFFYHPVNNFVKPKILPPISINHIPKKTLIKKEPVKITKKKIQKEYNTLYIIKSWDYTLNQIDLISGSGWNIKNIDCHHSECKENWINNTGTVVSATKYGLSGFTGWNHAEKVYDFNIPYKKNNEYFDKKSLSEIVSVLQSTSKEYNITWDIRFNNNPSESIHSRNYKNVPPQYLHSIGKTPSQATVNNDISKINDFFYNRAKSSIHNLDNKIQNKIILNFTFSGTGYSSFEYIKSLLRNLNKALNIQDFKASVNNNSIGTWSIKGTINYYD